MSVAEDMNQLESRLSALEQKFHIGEIMKSHDVDEIIEDYIRRNFCSMLSVSISVLSYASMASYALYYLYTN